MKTETKILNFTENNNVADEKAAKRMAAIKIISLETLFDGECHSDLLKRNFFGDRKPKWSLV